MRSVVALSLVTLGIASCVPVDSDDGYDDSYDDSYDDGWDEPDPSDGVYGYCHADDECSGEEVCGRDHGCYAASEVRAVRVAWTLHGEPASATTCASSETLSIQFSSFDNSFGYAPVPCHLGAFPIDKLPRAYDSVWLGPNYDGSDGREASLATPEITIDLPY